jgi:two-component system, cell cycle sensor histidine kinase and response regulator CckA
MPNARIMVVDDEPAVLNYMVTVLRRNGYDVHSAASASQALQKAQELSCGLNILITDIVMPGMTGDELVRSIRQICPYVDVLAVTGALDHSNQGFVNCRFLKKPFSPKLLVETVKDILSGQIH